MGWYAGENLKGYIKDGGIFSSVKHIPQVLADCMKEEKVKGFVKVIVASAAAEGISFL